MMQSIPQGDRVILVRLSNAKESRSVPIGVAFAAALSFALASFAASGEKSAPVAASSSLFESQVRPVLLASCVSCHGKDTAQGGLRLDIPISPEKAREVVRRIKGEGGKPRMPLGSTLSADKIAALERWVRSGAVWPSGHPLPASTLHERGKTHWAFQPIRPPSVPAVRSKTWVRNPIDAFVLKRIEAAGLSPSPTASRRELIRRVTYDLIGLPPSPAEVAAFEADTTPDVYEKLVDRLLASPHYGEKWGRHWLDLVRYAETNSYERDNPKPYVTRYRDYVIRAFNEDKPYDRFVREQIAGDEMPYAMGDAIAATAYYRLGIWDDEPADLQQATFDDLDDLITTTGQTFLGLTLDCARCHDHKLDPIPQADYYRFAAFFRNIVRFNNGGPTDEAMYFATAQEKREFEQKVAELDAKRKSLQSRLDALENRFKQSHALKYNVRDLSSLNYRYYEGSWARLPNFDGLKPRESGALAAGYIDTRSQKRNANVGFVFDGTLTVPAAGDYNFTIYSVEGVRLTIAGKTVIEKLEAGKQEAHLHGVIHLAAGPFPLRMDWVSSSADNGVYASWSGPGFALRPLAVLESSGKSLFPAVIAAELPQVLGSQEAAGYAADLKEKAALEKQQPVPQRTLCVSEHGAAAPQMFVLQRGNPATPGEKVEPGFPVCVGGGSAVPTLPPGGRSTGRRMALANWLTSPNNPLTARVIVNRIWQYHFGRGIVRTPSDFGLQGAKPTHPELLDWLTQEFIRQGWSIKKLSRLILTSNAYKQSSRPNPIGLAKDPQNDLFWRFDTRRLDAEEVRDSILAVCGNINLDMFGDSIYPEIPKEILAGQSIPGADWYTQRMKPADLNRRSIYIHVKRSLIYPLLASFDLPETDRTTATRFASTQPTQALSMINGTFVNNQAAILADRVRKEAGSDNQAFTRRLLTLVLQRTPTEAEINEGISLLDKLKRRGATIDQAHHCLCLMALNLNEFFYID